MRKKGQMEILGIALVVIILVIGVTFMLTLSLKPQERPHERFMKKQLSANLVDAILKTNTECKGYTFKTVLANCANRPPVGSINCGGTDRLMTCQYAYDNIASILDEVLGKMNYQYRFTAKVNRIHLIFKNAKTMPPIEVGRCTQFNIENEYVDVETPGIQPLPIERGILEIKLEICG